jgi:PKD repeat protein
MYKRKYKIIAFILLLTILSITCVSACKGSPQASFTVSVSSGQVPLTITFTNTSKNADEFRWEFGDGESKTTQAVATTVSHEYTQAGELIAKLTASKSDNPSVTSTTEITLTLTPGEFAQVNVVPEMAVVDIGGHQEFTAECTDAYGNVLSGQQLSWNVDSSAGSISIGNFTAGTKAGIFPEAVTATAQIGSAVFSGTASVTVNPDPLDAVSINPVAVAAGDTQQLEFSAVDKYGNQIPGLTGIWSLIDEDSGDLTRDGRLTASKNAGVYSHAVEVSVSQGNIERDAEAGITVVPGPLTQIGMAPEKIDIGIGMDQQCVVVGADDYGNIISGLDITWNASANAGTISTGGLFTAGPTPGSYEDGVSVTLSGDGVTLSTSADVNVIKDRIVFQSNQHNEDEDSLEVYIMDIDGSNVEKITNIGGDGVRGIPGSSPDGRRIAFTDGSNLYIVNTDGSWMTSILSGKELWDLSWSPDGSKIALEILEGNQWDIYVVDIDGSNLRQLTNNTADDMSPKWSPDGDKIVFVSTRDGNSELYIMNADGSNEQRVTNTDTWEWCPCWSPDGSEIYYTSINLSGFFQYYSIKSIKPDGSNERLVYGPNDRDIWYPSFSPDGNHFVCYVWMVNLDREIYKIDRNGSNPVQLTNNTANDQNAIWLPRAGGIPVTEDSVDISGKTDSGTEMTVQEVTALVRDSVVRIETELGSGSGFIIDSNGLILTNNHVISGAEEITVYLEDGTSYDGEVLARDPSHDMAVVKINAVGLPALEIGDYDSVELGQQVVVLGYPLGNENISVTSGLVSAVEYDSGTNITWIQTDSAVNPGNSGGPMLNLKGQIIGMVAAKIVGEAIEGIGYAISIVTINLYLPDLLD